MDFDLDKEYYYVSPFVFTIEKIVLRHYGEIEEDGLFYYIEDTGAYVAECCIFKTEEEAKGDALSRLNRFYGDKIVEIINSVPVRMED